MDTKSIFYYLEIFKNFPTYQFERRIDAFLLPYLAKAINQRFNLNDPELEFIYPEFPLMRLNNVDEKNQKLSDAADYLLWSKQFNTVYLVELKTETKSIHETQFKTYFFNCEQGWKNLIEYYILKATGNTQNWKKFIYGLLYFDEKAPDLIGGSNKIELSKYLLNSRGVHEYLKELRKLISFNKLPKVQFIYIAPQDAKTKLDEYVIQNLTSSDFYLGLLTLNEFANSTDEPLKQLLKNIDNNKNQDEIAKFGS